MEVLMAQHQSITSCSLCSILTVKEKQDALARIALDRGLINAHDFDALTRRPASYDLVELLFDLLAGRPGAVVFVLRAVQGVPS
jgi:hypothetical protein